MNEPAFKVSMKKKFVEQASVNAITNDSLQKIAKGAGLIFIGTIVGMFFGFGNRILFARFFSQYEYGIFSLAFVVLNICVIISTLGLNEGIARQIAYYRGKNELHKVNRIIISSVEIVILVSVFLSLVLFFTSDIISIRLFHETKLILPLKIISIAVPFVVLINFFISIFRGFDKVGPNVYFQNILRNGLFTFLLAFVIIFGFTFSVAICVFSSSFIITCILFAIYTLKKLPFSLNRRKNYNKSVGKELLIFSLPLLAVVMLNMIMNWTDTLMLGYYKTPDVVGLYNGAFPLAHLIPIALTSAGFIYVPIASGLYSKKRIREMGRIYQVLTKWIFSVTIPIILIFILFPEAVLNFLFGINYVQAASTLKILSFGFILHIFLGLNGLSLVVMGKTRFLMFVSLFGAISNVVLNIGLIPYFGIVGAAFASLISYWITNIFNSTKLYHISRIHPFTKNYLKPLVISIGLIILIYIPTSNLKIEFWMLPMILLIFLFLYILLLLLTKSFDREDIDLLLMIEKKIGINTKTIKRILNRFI